MTRPTVLALGTLLTLSIASQGRAQIPATAKAREEAVARALVRSIEIAGRPTTGNSIEERMRSYGVPAVSVAVVHEGRIDWAQAWGMADVEHARPATPATLFQAASMSKSVAALGAMRMVQAGRLSLDTDVNDALRSWRVPANAFTAQQPVTLRELLSHTAGLTVHGFPGYAATDSVPTVVQVLDGGKPANTAAVRVDTTPGALWRYSGGGYTVAQLLMADVSGQPFAALMDSLVLAPLAMRASTYRQPLPAAMRDRAATAYRSKGAAVEGLYHTYPEMAAAGLWTTPSDYARFVMALQHAYAGEAGAILSREMARTMMTPVRDDYGLGVGVSGAGDSLRFSHGGANEGFRSYFVGYATRGEGIVVMTNSDDGSPLANEIVLAAARVYGWPGLHPRVITPVAVAVDSLASYTATYRLQGTPLTVTRVDDRLYMAEGGGEPGELVPTGRDTFVYLRRGFPVRFERGGDGRVQALVGGGSRAERVVP